MNYFGHASAAQRYARGRPYFHPLAMTRIAAVCGPVSRALDVGCGTGQSTLALADIADSVVGIDPSRDMLDLAPSHARIAFVEAPAEAIPFAAGSFDLVTVALAFHWFDRRRFLPEAARVLRREGWLVIYNDGHAGLMAGNDDYARWNRDEYTKRFPTPSRCTGSPTAEEALEHALVLVARDSFTHSVTFTVDGLVRYLMTQSNIIAALELGGADAQSIGDWLTNSVAPFFRSDAADFAFKCSLEIFRRREAEAA